MNKDIIFINSSLSDGGSERVMTILANQFSNIGYNVQMVLVRDKTNNTYCVDDKVKLIRLKYKYKNKFYKMFSRIYQLRKIFKEKQVLIISFMSDINIFTLISNICLKNKVIVSERADPSKRSKFRRLMENILYKKAYKVVLQTEYVKHFFSKKVVEKSVVIPNPISNNLPKRNFNKINDVIVAAGRFTEQKNFKLLIDSFYEFNKKNNNYKLIIYGDGPQRKELELQISNLNLEKKVELPGYVKNVSDLMKDCKIYISSSNFEGISNSMLEAMSMGIPSICTDCPVYGARMVIENKINGILVAVKSKEDIVNAMIKLISDDKLYNNISKNGQKIKEKYSIEKIAKKWINIIE